MNPAGYHGQYLHVDLSCNQSRWVSLPEVVLRRFLGGTGLGVYLLLRTGQADLDPFSPEAGLAFVFSPLVGSPITTSAKFAVVGKSPLTNRYNDSLASSGFALAGKSIGADAILITGRAAAPSVLVIDGQRIELQPAASLWGLGVAEAEHRLRRQLGSGFSRCSDRTGRGESRAIRHDLARRTPRGAWWPGRRAGREAPQGGGRPWQPALPVGRSGRPVCLCSEPVRSILRTGHSEISRVRNGRQLAGL